MEDLPIEGAEQFVQLLVDGKRPRDGSSINQGCLDLHTSQVFSSDRSHGAVGVAGNVSRPPSSWVIQSVIGWPIKGTRLSWLLQFG